MAVDDARRPRRIIEGTPRFDAAALPLLRQADRFQRALLRPEKGAQRAERTPAQELSRTASQAPAPDAAPHSAMPDARHRAEPVRPSAQAPAPAPAAGFVAPQPPAAAPPVEEPASGAVVHGGADDDDAWQGELAHAVALLCNSADPGLEGWSVTLPMNAQALPQTVLRLELSPHWLALRFSTESARSLRVLSTQRASLAALLGRLLERDQSIDIEVT